MCRLCICDSSLFTQGDNVVVDEILCDFITSWLWSVMNDHAMEICNNLNTAHIWSLCLTNVQ